ncbi:MBOAT family O-acyltransferase [Ignatzschineria larvae DSM 13226]|uniref:Probable alginate O-acetylase n=1 Tax=Ignatzschineria larvae DSM 13226 TaxID=1111732 RepID=A0ABZ3C0W0_9GAMM|nr:MBOAT family O-acyltransferase [Ignatzschineria larvae]
MSYLSIEFATIFVLFFLLYWSLRPFIGLQNGLLLVSSYLVVGLFSLQFAIILASYTIVIYLLSTAIHSSRKPKLWLTIAVIAGIGNLAVFKYYNFFAPTLSEQLSSFGFDFSFPIAEIILPIGISFYTFHSISYLVSLSRKEIEPVNFFDFALFLSFFPSVIAGPINRAKDFLPQIQTRECRDVLEPHRAFMLIILAIIKVYWVSALFSEALVRPVFDNPSEFHTIELILAIYAYAVEIYLNFSGYTDLVTGIALLLGFKLPINFNAPYLATSLKQFWDKWHISLSTWIRDYIYFPLGGSRRGLTRAQINVMIAMILSGLWHGETLNFLIWGAIHGIGVVFLNLKDHIVKGRLVAQGLSADEVKSYFKTEVVGFRVYLYRFVTFNYICLGWIFFRSESFDDSIVYIESLWHNLQFELFPAHSLGLLLGLILLIFVVYPRLVKVPGWFVTWSQKIPWLLLPFLFIAILWGAIYMAPSGIPQFIYASF